MKLGEYWKKTIYAKITDTWELGDMRVDEGYINQISHPSIGIGDPRGEVRNYESSFMPIKEFKRYYEKVRDQEIVSISAIKMGNMVFAVCGFNEGLLYYVKPISAGDQA